MAPANTVTTSYLLGNLHCPSCVALIKSLLHDEYADRVLWVSPNVVTSVVTVEHEDPTADFIRAMGKTLQDAGFDICGVDTSAAVEADIDCVSPRDARQNYGTFDIWSRLWRNKTPPGTPSPAIAAAHLENCEACKSAVAHDQDHLSENRVRLVRTLSFASSIQRQTSAVPFDGVVVDGAPSPLLRATVSVGGMTCAVCVNTITNEVQKHPWISKITVNLVSNSASVDFTDPSRAKDIVEAISDLGYDAILDKVVDLNQHRQSADEREVEIKVDGIFCHRCPDRICQTLRNLDSSRIEILQEPTVKQPRLRVRYLPEAPRLTIRHILSAIEATDPSLHASIHHPPTLEERSRAIRAKHQRELLYREILTILIAIPSFILGIVYMSLVPSTDPTRRYLMEPWKSGLSRLEIILCVLATPVYFLAADVFHVRAVKELRTLWRGNSRTPLLERFYKFGSMNMLISLGTSIAYLSSVAQMIAAAINQETHVPEGRFYFDSVVFLTLFLLAGRLIEGYSKSKTGSAVEALAKLRPSTALLIEQDRLGNPKTTATEIDRLEHGDLIRIPNGASPAADGVIVTGDTNFDESSLTGESRPIKKGPGDSVYAGTINKADAITVRITGTCGKSMLDQIVEVVREGQTKRAPVEQIADLMTSYFVPVVTLIAVITWAVWMALAFTGHVSDEELNNSGGQAAFAFQFAIAVFVVACPCGLALAAPTAIFVGGGIAAKHGVLAKGGGEAFEKASKIDCVVFDKTGTLTEGGEPRITDSALFPDGEMDDVVDERTLLSGLKAAEENSSHPIAKAVVSFCGAELESAALGKVEELPGKGIKAAYKDRPLHVAVGNEHLMRDLSVPLSQRATNLLQGWKSEAKSVALVGAKAREGSAWKLAAIMAVSDPIRPEARAVVQALRGRGTQVWMLSGDNMTTAQAVAQRVGIPSSNVLAEATVHADETGRRRRRGHGYSTRRAMVAMVGDGINDSPALTTADVGIAIGSGSDVAISSADFVLATSSLSAVLTLLELSRVVFRRIKVNFGWAVVYNMLAVPIAAGCLYAVRTRGGGHVRLDPVWAALAMALSSISVVLSSLSLRIKIPWVGFRPKTMVAEPR
ncbi:e1-E2 ATPase domain-containing protein [Hirsutella rhossiliensis]|uniref:E1-E2 ATPase domain-containing protein n=1 Tax=Hirsutella rhossiliensis TaxID=111463 RepID=A0A9P8MWE3_9HYPO|nr:e1-E2 ATPase domain-containing protein [Hirsutella rhossiliensis]KAH0961619.1 e1-E2 ATPase domain-containing protein [Hirsutella rhossiliensis]